jgi:diamine N-acetyltransferase
VNLEVISCDYHHLSRIKALAEVVWKPTFSDILPQDRLDYLFDFMYHEDKLTQQLKDNQHHFYLLNDATRDVGYAQLVVKNPEVKLEKIYLLQDVQGKGYGLYLLNFLIGVAKQMGCKRMQLQVNRGNTKAVDFYKRFGFKIDRSEDFDVGGGHVMDDYVMSLDLK